MRKRTLMRISNKLGLLYFIVHFIIEVTCYYIMGIYDTSNTIMILAFVYDFIAFVPEGFYGALRDIGVKINFAAVGLVLSSSALIMLYFNVFPLIVVIVLTIGNGLIHVEGAEETLRNSNGKIFPSAFFVAGGAFGVITGKLLSHYMVNIWIILAINLLTIVPLVIAAHIKRSADISSSGKLQKQNHFQHQTDNTDTTTVVSKPIGYSQSKPGLAAVVVIICATFVVIVRSYMGFILPIEWNDSLTKAIPLFCSMGLGKALGGWLVDYIGIRKTITISTLGALPFILLGNSTMILSLIGIMMFSMTMAIALALLVSVMNNYPGVAFGFTTVGLFLGVVFAYVFHFDSYFANCLVISALSVICFIILYFISNNHIENNKAS